MSFDVLNEMESHCVNVLEKLYHPSLAHMVRNCQTIHDIDRLEELNRARTAAPNTTGKVSVPENCFTLNTLTQDEIGYRKLGVLRGHTTCTYNSSSQSISFRCDSYVHPEIWFEGVLQMGSRVSVPISGRLSVWNSSLYAKVLEGGHRVSVKDVLSPDLWAEFDLPSLEHCN